jgi:DNA (cytosine-5)-methyltransferase 1
MKLGGLFSGVGGFELAWTQLGHEVAWMCEIDKSARKVLEQRFPGVPIYEDVERLDPAEVEAVDVLTGGSPCQGFSVAGTRSGLEHGESRLFADYIRIMNGLAERGLKWALWENVPGVLSITNDDGERTFEHVVTALVGGTVPVRLGQGRWNTGLADGGGRAVAWRVLDSRHFGVAQRRRRVFACVAFGGVAANRAGRALLAKPEGVSGDSEAGGSEREGVAGGARDGAKGASAVLMTMREGCDGGGKGPLLVEEESLTLATGNGQTLFQPQAFRKAARAQSAEDDESWVADGQANTLNTFDMGDTRTTHAIVEPVPIQDTREVEKRQNGLGVGQPGEPSFTLDTASRAGFGTNYGVRRLTPVECERLQAFPDGWTEPAGSDSARYKALGNAVTVNTVRWVLGRMLEQS